MDILSLLEGHSSFLSKGGNVALANEVGKRYICKKCGAEFIVTKGGTGAVVCCKQQMELKK